MVARLGRVLFWAAFGIAAIAGISGIYLLIQEPLGDPVNVRFGLSLVAIAVVIWLIGRALRYVLANE